MKDDESEVLTEAVAEWLEADSDETMEFILEFAKPKRTVSVRSLDSRRHQFEAIEREEASSAAPDPAALGDSVQEITHRDAVLLRSAGAIAFAANAAELSEVAMLPGVKAIRFNRRLSA
ncbi:MAG: hypothetical protein AAF585_02035 [Verrucomicrobiota bacterium]